MATITAQTGSGQVVSYTAANSGGDVVAFGTAINRPLLIVRNGGGSAITLTVAGKVPCSQNVLHAQTYSCAVGDTEIPVPASCVDLAQATYGQVSLSYSSATSVSVGALGA